MPQANSALTSLIEETRALLSANQANLQTLLQHLDQYLQTKTANGQPKPMVGLQNLYKQSNHQLNQTQALTTLLETNLEGTTLDMYPLSRIEILQRQAEDRAKTAKDLEDNTGQLLANAIFELAAVKQLIKRDDNAEQILNGLDALQKELEEGLTDLRLLIANLQPHTILGNFGLIAGLRRYLEKLTIETGLATDIDVQTDLEPLPNTIETAIFRVIQEALKNVRQHAQANQVKITITEKNEALQFSIVDDGIGFGSGLSHQPHRHLGLVEMKEVANLLDGTLELKSKPNQGTQVILTIPYPNF